MRTKSNRCKSASLPLATSPNHSFSDITNLPHQLRVPIAEIALRRGFPQPKKPPGEPFARLFAGEDPPGSQMSQTEPVSVCPWLEGRRCIGCVSHRRVTSRQHIFCDYHHLVIVIPFFHTQKLKHPFTTSNFKPKSKSDVTRASRPRFIHTQSARTIVIGRQTRCAGGSGRVRRVQPRPTPMYNTYKTTRERMKPT